MIDKKQTVFNAIATSALVLVFAICGCKSQQGQPTSQAPAALSPAGQHLENGAYLILREAPTPQEARVAGGASVVLAYDDKKYNDAPGNEPVSYVAIDPNDYIPLIIEGTPEMKSVGQGKTTLTVSLSRRNAERAEAFTRAHLGGRIAMVVDGEIVSMHGIKSVITGGKMQISTCAGNACEVIRSKLVN